MHFCTCNRLQFRHYWKQHYQNSTYYLFYFTIFSLIFFNYSFTEFHFLEIGRDPATQNLSSSDTRTRQILFGSWEIDEKIIIMPIQLPIKNLFKLRKKYPFPVIRRYSLCVFFFFLSSSVLNFRSNNCF